MDAEQDINQRAPNEEQPAADPNWLPRWEIIALGLVDLVVLTIFAIIGRASHDTPTLDGPFVDTMNTAMPFMVAWLLVGIVVGMYRGKALFPVGRVILRTGLNGLFAGPLGVVFRAIWLGRPVSWTFMAVATGVSTLMMLIWRVGWSRLRRLWWPEVP